MARKYRLWVEKDEKTGKPISCGVRPLTKTDERMFGDTLWQQLAESNPLYPLGGPWQLLLRLLNMERCRPNPLRYDAKGKRTADGIEIVQKADWDAWKVFCQEAGVPYLLTEEQGHPLVWFPATDGKFYGILFDFGLIPGKWYRWIPGTERYEIDPESGGMRIIVGEAHPEVPAGQTIRELLASAPKGLLDVNIGQQLSLQEALEIQLHRHTQEEIDRCRFYVFHEGVLVEDEPFALQTVERVREFISRLAWTWLSPHIEFWDPFIRAQLGGEVGGDPNVELKRTADKLLKMAPDVRFAKTFSYCGGNPLEFLLTRLDKTTGFTPAVSSRVLPSLANKAKDAFWRRAEEREDKEERRRQTEAARKQLTGSVRLREELTTTDLFAVAAQQLMWAVKAGLKLRACPHPGCGKAFLLFPEEYRRRYCPEHQGEAPRSIRYRMKNKNERRCHCEPVKKTSETH